MFRSKFKEAWLCLKAGRVTLPYPFAPHPPASGFRGKPEIDGEKCIGCGTCATVCPPRLITLNDDKDYRRVTVDYSRCTYCARCEDVCPEHAIQLTQDFELATNTKEDLVLKVEMKLAHCTHCGQAFTSERLLQKTIQKLSSDWETDREIPEWVYWCPECRKTTQAQALVSLEEIKHV